MLKKILLALMFTVVAAMANAQPDLFHRPGFLAGRTFLTLSLFEEVRTELKTSPDFNTKSDALLEKVQGEMTEVFQNANGDFADARVKGEAINAKYDDELVKLLTPDQLARLKQLFIQFNGGNAIANPTIEKDLSITDDQKAKIKQVQADSGKKMMGLFGSGGSPEDNMKAMQKLQEDQKADLEKVLTDDQKAKFKTMQGDKFEFKKFPAPGA